MSYHTKGRLTFRRSQSGQLFLWSYAHKDPICGVLKATVTLTPEEGLANAMRLKACWNAADGISTEALEQSENIEQSRADKFFALGRVIQERDELLAALRDVMDDLATASETWRDSSAGPATVPGEPRPADSMDVTEETQEKVRALLAKHTPKVTT